MNELFQAVKNLIFFLLLVTVFSNLLGKSSFKKYIHIFVGLVIIVIVIRPVLTWTNSLDKVDHYYALNMYQNNAKDISAEIVGAEEEYKKQVVDSYKEAIYEQIQIQMKNYGLTVDSLEVSIEEDSASERCGQVNAITLVASKKEREKEEEHKDVAPIDQVIIDKVKIHENIENEKTDNEDGSEVDKFDTVQELTIKQELVSLYGVAMDNVAVTIYQ